MAKYIKCEFMEEFTKYDVALWTSNGSIKRNGEAVMGAGLAKQLKIKYPVLPKMNGKVLSEHGNHVHSIARIDGTILCCFPVKHQWMDKANLVLIEQSCKELMKIMNDNDINSAIVNYPGIGNGKLNPSDVRPILDSILDDRVTVCYKYEPKDNYNGEVVKYKKDNRTITIVGSREIPDDHLSLLTEFAHIVDQKGFTLRSGGADGSDSAVDNCKHKKVYLPWDGFNGHKHDGKDYVMPLSNFKEALDIVESIHPAWDKCSHGAKKLHGRNVYQILGDDLHTLPRAVVCYTKNGEVTGGTATAIRLAKKYDVQVINIGSKEGYKVINDYVNKYVEHDEYGIKVDQFEDKYIKC